MQLTISFLLIGALVCVSALPASTKEKLNKRPPVKDCPECPTNEKVICAKGDGYTFSYINECVLKLSNCQNGRNMVKISDGPCPGQTGIRLS